MGFDFLFFCLRRGAMAPVVWFFMPSRGGVLLRKPIWFFAFFAGIRDVVFAVHASPLCGAAPTFLCRRKEK
ncbi:hypothetical protein [Paraburkholderia terrae]|nr:hypothetical protein [Paraburkholderia terrae]